MRHIKITAKYPLQPAGKFPLLATLGLFLLLCLFCSACGVGRYHVVYQQNPQVFDRATGTQCTLDYFQFSEWEVMDVYGPPCSVVLKRKIAKLKSDVPSDE